MKLERASRNAELRERNTRQFVSDMHAPGGMPMDIPIEGDYQLQWVRTHYNGADEDKGRLAQCMSQGWVPVKAEEVPEELRHLKDNRGHISICGTVLCKIPAEKAQAIYEKYKASALGRAKHADSQFETEERRSNMPKFALNAETTSLSPL